MTAGLVLPPEPDGRHVCVPPLERREILLPVGPAGSSTGSSYTTDQPRPRTTGHVLIEPPVAESTWACPGCGRVWVVVIKHGRGYGGQYGRGYSPDRRLWVRASRRVARRHVARLNSGSAS